MPDCGMKDCGDDCEQPNNVSRHHCVGDDCAEGKNTHEKNNIHGDQCKQDCGMRDCGDDCEKHSFS